MDALKRQVAIAYRRLLIQRFLGLLAWSWFATLVLAAIAVAVPKIFPLELDSFIWSTSWIGGAVLVGLVVAAVWTYATRLGPLEAAIEIDRRFGLKERVSSTFALDESELVTPAGKALGRGGGARVQNLHVQNNVGVKVTR